jgi:hypothetical protein
LGELPGERLSQEREVQDQVAGNLVATSEKQFQSEATSGLPDLKAKGGELVRLRQKRSFLLTRHQRLHPRRKSAHLETLADARVVREE